MACRVVGVSRSCYYEFKYHVPSDRQIRRLLLTALVSDIHKRSRGTYGMLRIRAALLREQNMVVNKKLILSIMRELGLKGLPGPKRRKKKGAPEEEVPTTPPCTYEKKIAGPAPVPVIEQPDPEKTRAVVESVA